MPKKNVKVVYTITDHINGRLEAIKPSKGFMTDAEKLKIVRESLCCIVMNRFNRALANDTHITVGSVKILKLYAVDIYSYRDCEIVSDNHNNNTLFGSNRLQIHSDSFCVSLEFDSEKSYGLFKIKNGFEKLKNNLGTPFTGLGIDNTCTVEEYRE